MVEKSDLMDFLNVFGIYLAILNYQENLEQSSNSDIMAELHNQNTEFLTKMMEKIDRILSILEQSISTN